LLNIPAFLISSFDLAVYNNPLDSLNYIRGLIGRTIIRTVFEHAQNPVFPLPQRLAVLKARIKMLYKVNSIDVEYDVKSRYDQ